MSISNQVNAPGIVPTQTTRRLRLTSAAAVTPTPVNWLWPSWLARGKLHILGGHPGDGKSTIATAVAAALSRGERWPDGVRAPVGQTLILAAEDGIADTVVPRLTTHHADTTRIQIVDFADVGGRPEVFSLIHHLDLLEEAVAGTTDLVIIDPLTSYMPGSDRNAEGGVRDVLTPLAVLAEHTGVAILAIMHVGKPNGTGRRPLQQLLGATAFGAVARIVWMTATLPEDAPDGGDRALGVVKSNLAPRPDALCWSRPMDAPIQWHGSTSTPIEALLSESGTTKPASPREEAVAILQDLLADGPMPASAVRAAAQKAGISWRTVERAAREINVQSVKEPGSQRGQWIWTLPDEKTANPSEGDVAAFQHDGEKTASSTPSAVAAFQTDDEQTAHPGLPDRATLTDSSPGPAGSIQNDEPQPTDHVSVPEDTVTHTRTLSLMTETEAVHERDPWLPANTASAESEAVAEVADVDEKAATAVSEDVAVFQDPAGKTANPAPEEVAVLSAAPVAATTASIGPLSLQAIFRIEDADERRLELRRHSVKHRLHVIHWYRRNSKTLPPDVWDDLLLLETDATTPSVNATPGEPPSQAFCIVCDKLLPLHADRVRGYHEYCA